ncbi:gamma-glutamyl-gamma-aminobutyrate hydrolase family protein [Corynebacterium sp. MC-17D]|uniref:anthranilate synthase n=1 Tax=Corynebacterium lipophilum TaxID=2804918 RepID=A0AAW5HUY2_9CORY|nr:gamma-glutamyl-gamma-aminobutyrate hydrolase family protein [Corynebacterium lipophilum]MCO6395109.1 gamma-glutamyl-gamma-aminobutyrate hydrolase family protein [Corynebacterium lipophilum]MCZ2116861.1 gamma-glutamyl-gamma-aminobutyrate hydrolase family protein [Corynebacterium lipophilum]
MIVLLDNQDSFVYNLVDALAEYESVVFRNTVDVNSILALDPSLIVLSPGPGYPGDAGCMPELIRRAQGSVPMLGICLGYQALVEHFGGTVQPCGPVHGVSDTMRLTSEGLASGLFRGMTSQLRRDVPVARYHSLGAVSLPAEMHALARTGDIVMAAETNDGMSIGLQFHPESILTPAGPTMLRRCVDKLKKGN